MTERRQVVSPFVERQPQAGDVYEFTRPCATLGGHHYYREDRLVLIEKTDDAPHGFWNPQGNWRCRALAKSPDLHQLVSVWSSIHDGIAAGTLRLVSEPTSNPLPRFDRKEPV